MNFETQHAENENHTSNATLNFHFGGAARNAAEIFKKISQNETSKIFTLVGDDPLGNVLKADLIKN